MLKQSKEDKISALYICADIFDYPNECVQKVENLKQFVDNPTKDFDLSYIQSEYIRIFSINSTKLKCVPYASWWLDGKMSGLSTSKINSFYKRCGYVFDEVLVEKPIDHISLMITFIAILLEEDRLEEIYEFVKFLPWLDNFSNSLDKATDIKYFKLAVDVTSQIINSLQEEA